MVQPRFVIAVLLLEVLRPQEQSFSPQYFGWNTHAVSLIYLQRKATSGLPVSLVVTTVLVMFSPKRSMH
jgi:hypothetical protein